MTPDTASFVSRLERLERRMRRTRALAVAAGIALLATWVTGFTWQRAPQVQDGVRTRLLVIEDAQGRARIVLGAPMPDGRQYVGMKILNPDGAEQFGLGLKTDGSVSMGFDTRPGVGNPANSERLNMGVTATGQGWIRYLDNGTRARLRIALDSADVPSVQFLDWPSERRIVVRELRFAADTTFEWTH
ncbi:MAG TPA: hypothetical protein VK505_05160 [Steroidobacteraceae bacterium]|nr:hypothetical protein [Steroidobacteraceae bacterium]